MLRLKRYGAKVGVKRYFVGNAQDFIDFLKEHFSTWFIIIVISFTAPCFMHNLRHGPKCGI